VLGARELDLYLGLRRGMSSHRMFVSYSHKDDYYRERFYTALAGLRHQGQISLWDDHEVAAGVEWESQILEQLSAAGLIVFLVSPDLLNSEYIYGKEMDHALALHRNRRARVIPVIVRPADWEQSPLGNLQALPRYGRAVSSWPNEDEAWLDVTRGIRRIIKQADS
jgi:TIR domain